MSKALEVIGEMIGTDEFYDILDRVSDKILESGSLSDTIGNETQFSINVEIDGEDVFVNVDLQPEDELSLSADALDDVGDYFANQVNTRALQSILENAGLKGTTLNVLSNVTINGERPSV